MEIASSRGRPVLRVSYSLAEARADFVRLRDSPVEFDRERKWVARTSCPIPRPLALTRLTERGQRFANYFHFVERIKVAKPGRVAADTLLRRHHAGETRAVRNAVARMRRSEAYARAAPETLVPLAVKTNSALMSVNQFPAHVAQTFARALGARSVLDFCGGWGDRLAGFLAAPATRRVVVIEPRTASHPGYKRELVHSGRADVNLVTIPDVAERAIGRVRGSFDLIMTSPPYAGAEVYDSARHKDSPATQPGDAYVDEWLGPILARCVGMLRTGGALVINVDDSPTSRVEICARLLRYMRRVDCDFVGTIGLRKRGRTHGLMGGAGDHPFAEPIYIWSRPGEGAAARRALLSLSSE
jgi:hypothetical protein